jgi:hypothetical protein
MQTLYYIGNKMYAKGIFVVLLFVATVSALSPYNLEHIIEKKGDVSDNVYLFVSIRIVRENFSYPVVLDCKFTEYSIVNSTNTNNDNVSPEFIMLAIILSEITLIIGYAIIFICVYM